MEFANSPNNGHGAFPYTLEEQERILSVMEAAEQREEEARRIARLHARSASAGPSRIGSGSPAPSTALDEIDASERLAAGDDSIDFEAINRFGGYSSFSHGRRGSARRPAKYRSSW